MFSRQGMIARCFKGGTLAWSSHSLVLPKTASKVGGNFSHTSCLTSLPGTGFAVVRETEKIEEETITLHRIEDYYPVSLGEVFRSRYQVVSKQGYGVGSTVWLCRDLIANRHLTLKVCVRRARQQSHELEISEHLRKFDKTHKRDHPGKKLVQTVLDSFEIDGPNGRHVCLLYQPLGMKLSEVIARMPNGLIPVDVLQRTTQLIFIALDYIHRRGIVHTGEFISRPKEKEQASKQRTMHVANASRLISV